MDKPLQRVPDFQLLLGDDQFRAIGHMIVQWGYLESTINEEIAWLLTRAEHSQERVNFQARFSTRAVRWQELARKSYKDHPARIKSVARVVSQANKIKHERDDYAHGNISGSGLFFTIRQGRVIEISDTLGQPAYIEDLACRISTISGELFKHHLLLRRSSLGGPP